MSRIILQGRPRARHFGTLNWRGMATFYRREIQRGFKIWTITLAAPAIRALLFAGVFTLVVGDTGKVVLGMPFLEFLIPGLVMMAIIQNAFANSSSSLIQSKVSGNIVFVLITPLSFLELFMAYVGASLVRAFAVGFLAVGIGIFLADRGVSLTTFGRGSRAIAV